MSKEEEEAGEGGGGWGTSHFKVARLEAGGASEKNRKER